MAGTFGPTVGAEEAGRPFDFCAAVGYHQANQHGRRAAGREADVDEYIEKHPIADADISDVVSHIDHVVELVGIDHVGLGPEE